jgi:hypothetical protein
MTNEHRSSKTCVFCYKQVNLARSRRRIGDKIKTIRVHGALECVNPECSSFKAGYTIKPRDSQAALCIAIAGASCLLNPCRDTLPPFSKTIRPTIITDFKSVYNSKKKLLISARDTTRAPTGQVGL